MEVNTIDYRGSFPNVVKCPADTRPEFAFIGRSNVGKSSLINMLGARKDLAHTSKKPGKTQMINYFLVNHQWHLVDLPGYGYAKISKTTRKKWEKMIQDYLAKRMNLVCTFVLIDSNVSPQKIDLEFIDWLGEMHIPFVLVFTKVDRLKKDQVNPNVEAFKTAMLNNWEAIPQYFISSANSGQGREDILSFIRDLVKEYEAYV